MKVVKRKFNNYIMYCRAKEFNTFLISKIKKDPFYPLDKKTKSWMKPLLKKLDRPFEIDDFE